MKHFSAPAEGKWTTLETEKKMSTDFLSKMTSLAELQSFAKDNGLDLNQAPIVEDDESGRRRMRRWIRQMLASLPPEPVEPKVTPEESETLQEEEIEVTPPEDNQSEEHADLSQPEESEESETLQEEEIEVTPPEDNQPEQHADLSQPEEPKTPQEKQDPIIIQPPWWYWLTTVVILVMIGIVIWLILRPTGNVPTTIPTDVPVSTAAPTDAPKPAATAEPIVTDGKALAEKIWGEPLPDQPEMYVAGGDGFPQICSGLCWDTSKLNQGIMKYYGPWNGEEDISQSDAAFGDGNTGPLELMRSGKVTKVIFYLGKEAQLEVCAIGSLDGQKLSEILGIKDGECGKRVAIQPGWHVVENNANSPISGFGVRFSASGWAGMTESQIVTYTSYWTVSGDTATWIGPKGVEILMPPSLVSMMQDYGTVKNIMFTTSTAGQVLFCNGYVDGDANLSSPDGSCQLFDVPAGTFTYHGEDRLSAGISWQPAK